eukprot:3258488-Pleurochrysis_carterae.AAC.1
MRQTGGVSFSAGGAGWRAGTTKAARRVASELSESLEVSPPAMEAAVHEVSGFVCRHHLDMRGRLRRVDS